MRLDDNRTLDVTNYIRTASSRDLPLFVALQVEGWRQMYAELLPATYMFGTLREEKQAFWERRFSSPRENQLLAVCEIRGAVQAIVSAFGVSEPRGEACIEHLHVAKNVQRNGVGRAMMQYAARWAVERCDSGSLTLLVAKHNLQAIAFYERLGGTAHTSSIWQPACGGAVEMVEFKWADVASLSGLQ